MPSEQTPSPAPGTPPPPTTPAGSQTETSSSQDLILKVLGAIGTGVGVLGFVTLFGGAILWLRVDKANLPANDAVAAMPNSLLVTTGASFLVPAVLLALLAVTIIYLLHLGFYVPRRIKQRNAFKDARTRGREADELEREARAQTLVAQAARASATSLCDIAEQAKANPGATQGLKERLAAEAAAQVRKAEAEEATALEKSSKAAEKKAEAEKLQADAEFALERTGKQFVIELAVGAIALLILPAAFNGAIFNVDPGEFVILVLVALIATAVSLATYVATDKFVWFGVVAFITVGVYIGFATYYSTTGNPKVEPAAALRADRPPVIGIYVADTASNLYLGSFPETGKPTRLMVIPRTQVTDLAIGPLLDREKAKSRALSLALDHCEMKISVPKTEKEAAYVKAACTDEQKAALAAQLG